MLSLKIGCNVEIHQSLIVSIVISNFKCIIGARCSLLFAVDHNPSSFRTTKPKSLVTAFVTRLRTQHSIDLLCFDLLFLFLGLGKLWSDSEKRSQNSVQSRCISVPASKSRGIVFVNGIEKAWQTKRQTVLHSGNSRTHPHRAHLSKADSDIFIVKLNA